MKSVFFFVFMILGVSLCLHAGNPSPVVQAERDFSRTAGEKGVRTAFLEYLAENSVVFENTPVPGKKAYEARPDNPGILYWQPSFSEISAGGDLAYSTGPWHWQNKREEEPVAYGQFVSIWRKQQDGSWKVEVDLGCKHGKPAKPVSSYADLVIPERPSGKTKKVTDSAEEHESLLQADREFARAAAGNVQTAYREWLVENARFLRDGMEPVDDRGKVAESLEKQPGERSWEPAAAGVASTGDLGYTYGTANSAGQNGHYLRVWKRQNDDRWKVALEVITARPD